MNNFIQLSKIDKSFDTFKKVKVLKKISKKKKKGKIYSLIGPSGSGKSTLLNLLSLIDRPSSGTIIIDNKKINFNESNKNDILRANKIGSIYQQDNLLPDFTAVENVYLASLAAGNNKKLSISKANLIISPSEKPLNPSEQINKNIVSTTSNTENKCFGILEILEELLSIGHVDLSVNNEINQDKCLCEKSVKCCIDILSCLVQHNPQVLRYFIIENSSSCSSCHPAPPIKHEEILKQKSENKCHLNLNMN